MVDVDVDQLGGGGLQVSRVASLVGAGHGGGHGGHGGDGGHGSDGGHGGNGGHGCHGGQVIIMDRSDRTDIST